MPASTQLHGDSSSSESVSCTTLQSTNTSAMSSTTMRTNGRERVKNNTAELELMSGLAKRCMEDPEGDFIGVSDDVKFRRANVTECVPVASSDHVAEIVGKQGAKIKALRLRTSTYIKTPCRGDEPVFIITGRREDVMIAKQEILSAADQVSMLRARRSLQQVSANGTATSNATEAIAASNLLAASAASFNLVPTLPAAVAALNNLNAAALMNAGLTNSAVNLAGVSMAALNATTPSAGYVAAASLQNALLSNLAAAAPTSLQQTLASSALSQTLPAAALLQRSATNGSAQHRAPQQQATTSQLCAAPSRSSASPAGSDAPNQAGSVQNAQTSASNGVTPINLATMSNSRVLSRLALASGVTHGNPMAVLNALNGGGLLAGLPSYMPPGFNLATAKHIAQLRVPERIVGLVVGPRGATIKQIQQKTNTYILTPSKGDRDAIFEIIGTAEGCATAKQDIEDYVLSRTGMTVDQLLSQQSQVRTLEAICQAAGLNVNRLVTNALANVPSPNVDLASLGLGQPLATSVAGSQLGIAHLSEALTAAANSGATTLQDHLQMMGAATRAPKVANSNGSDAYTTDSDVTGAIQSLLASLVARKSSDQLQSCVSDVNASDRLRLFDNGWRFDEHTLKGTDAEAEAEAEEHNGITNGMAATQSDLMNHSMFDAVYENLNSLVSGLDDTSMTLVDRENDVPHYSINLRAAHHNAEAPNFGNTYAMPASNSNLTATSRFENDAADVAVPERRSSASLKSLLAGLGLDTALCVGGPSSSGFASPSTSTTSGLGASLNGFAASGYQQRAATTNGASSASSGGSSPAFDMFNSRGMPTDNLLHTLTAMRI